MILPLSVPGTEINGEKANDNKPGLEVLLIKLVTANKNPRNAPLPEPSKIEPTITGICIIVAFMNPS